MSRRTAPATRTTAPPMYYFPVQSAADLIVYTPAELAERRRQDAVLVARWKQRQAAIAERDRKTRRFLLGLGAVVGVGVLAGLAGLGWLAHRALAGLSAPEVIGAVAAVLIVLGFATVAGHRCVTIVQHWH